MLLWAGLVDKESCGGHFQQIQLTETDWGKSLHFPVNCTSQKPRVDLALNSMGSTK